jgi:hypothetical protein
VTGSIVDQAQHEVRKLDNGDTALDLTLSFTDAQTKQSVSDAKASAFQLNGVHGWIPLVLLVIGLFAIAVAFLIGRRRVTSSGTTSD